MLVSTNIKAQIPVNDPAWILQTDFSEEFDSTALRPSKWSIADPTNIGPYSVVCYTTNVSLGYNSGIGSGTVKIKADSMRLPKHDTIISGKVFKYQGGSIGTVYTAYSYKFGYIEIHAKYPIGQYAYWPAFWTWKDSCATPVSYSWYNEIDVCENAQNDALIGHNMGTNIHLGNLNSCSNDNSNEYSVTGLPRLDSIFHKYAIQWGPNNLNFYFDDSLVRSVYDATGNSIAQKDMWALLNFNVDTTYANNHNVSSSFPAYFEIDYLHYYKLNTQCGTDKTICTPSTDYYNATPKRAVEKTITTGGSGCGGSPSVTFNTSDKCTLRATDYVILDKGTTISDDGSGQFVIMIEPCPN